MTVKQNLPIGLLLIGQSPRPDLTEPIRQRLPGATLIEAGALDGLSVQDLPDPSLLKNGTAYPLSTRMATGELVIVPESFLLPRLQQAGDRLVAQGCGLILLLCAGTFEELHTSVPLMKPFDLAVAALKSLGVHRLALFAPFAQQQDPILKRWQQAGFDCKAWTPPVPGGDDALATGWQGWLAQHRPEILTQQAVVLDYVGHPASVRKTLLNDLSLPVLDIGHLSGDVLASLTK